MEWKPASSPALPHPGELHLWRLALDDSPPPAGLDALLAPEELARANQFRFSADRTQYITTHAWLRILLGEYLHRAPDQVQFLTGFFGKPALAGGGLCFNLTHIRALSVIAVALAAEVGVDIEQRRPMPDLLDLSGTNFTSGEHQKLLSLRGEARIAAFFRCWTRKEAVVKAEGSGLSRPLRSFEVSLLEEEAPAVLWSSSEQPLGACQLLEFDPGYDASGALALRTRGGETSCSWSLHAYQWSAGLPPSYLPRRSV